MGAQPPVHGPHRHGEQCQRVRRARLQLHYTREIAYLWEEIAIPIPYTAEADEAERVLLEAARPHAVPAEQVERHALREMQRRYLMAVPDTEPRVFYRLTDNWLELTVRFLVPDHGIREVKDAVSRDILRGLTARGIPIASTTIQLVAAAPSGPPAGPHAPS